MYRNFIQILALITLFGALTACSKSDVNWQALINDAEQTQAMHDQAQTEAGPATLPPAPTVPSGPSAPKPSAHTQHQVEHHNTPHCHAVKHQTCQPTGNDASECTVTYTQECD